MRLRTKLGVKMLEARIWFMYRLCAWKRRHDDHMVN